MLVRENGEPLEPLEGPLDRAERERDEAVAQRDYWKRELLSEQADYDKARAELDAAYRERNQVAAGLAHLVIHLGGQAAVSYDSEEPEWPVLLIELPTGQVSWHFSQGDLDLLEGIPHGGTSWDGHTTAEKYERLQAVAGLEEE